MVDLETFRELISQHRSIQIRTIALWIKGTGRPVTDADFDAYVLGVRTAQGGRTGGQIRFEARATVDHAREVFGEHPGTSEIDDFVRRLHSHRRGEIEEEVRELDRIGVDQEKALAAVLRFKGIAARISEREGV